MPGLSDSPAQQYSSYDKRNRIGHIIGNCAYLIMNRLPFLYSYIHIVSDVYTFLFISLFSFCQFAKMAFNFGVCYFSFRQLHFDRVRVTLVHPWSAFSFYTNRQCVSVCVFFSLLNIVIILKWEWFRSIIIVVVIVIVILLLLLLLLRFPLPRYQSLGILWP